LICFLLASVAACGSGQVSTPTSPDLARPAESALTVGDPTSYLFNPLTNSCVTVGATMTVQSCTGAPAQYPYFTAGGDITTESATGIPTAQVHKCMGGNFLDNSVSMMPCGPAAPNTSIHWGREGDLLRLAGPYGIYCLAVNASNVLVLEQCTFAKPNQSWTTQSPIAADWPYTGKTQVVSYSTAYCLQQNDFSAPLNAPGHLFLSTCAFDVQYEYFTFGPQGTITLAGLCLAAEGSQVALETCAPAGASQLPNQVW
jgi:hypothetical protein